MPGQALRIFGCETTHRAHQRVRVATCCWRRTGMVLHMKAPDDMSPALRPELLPTMCAHQHSSCAQCHAHAPPASPLPPCALHQSEMRLCNP
eukprot:8236610-Karenia_brevis.AAC.1